MITMTVDLATFAQRLAGTDPRDLKAMRDMMTAVIDEGGPLAPEYRDKIALVDAALQRSPLYVGTVPRNVPRDRYVGGNKGEPSRTAVGEPASEKQQAFVAKLLAERDYTGRDSVLGPVTPPTDLTRLSKRQASALIERLLGCPVKPAAHPASEKQIALLARLFAEKDWAGVVTDASGNEISVDTAQPFDPTAYTGGRDGTASKLIDALFAAPRKNKGSPVLACCGGAPEVVHPGFPCKVPDLTAGAYRVDGKIIRVYLGQHSGRMLCAELTDPTASSSADAWSYLGLATRFVRPEHKLTVDEVERLAQDLGTENFSWCWVCGRRLDDPNSVARSIGPVCRAKQEER